MDGVSKFTLKCCRLCHRVSGRCLDYKQVGVCSYEQERLPRVKTIHAKGVDSAAIEDKEKYLFKPTFKPLWQKQVFSMICCVALPGVNVLCRLLPSMHCVRCLILQGAITAIFACTSCKLCMLCFLKHTSVLLPHGRSNMPKQCAASQVTA